METIIHIGQHKTGSTSLQNFLFQNASELGKQKYFYTNKILSHENTSHYILNVYALHRNRFSSKKESIIKTSGEEYINELDKYLPAEIKNIYTEAIRQNCNKVIWSNEGLYLLNSKKEYKKLLNLFKPFSSKVTVICCFRNKKSYRISYSKQLQKQKLTPLNNPDSYRYLKTDSWLFDYKRKKKILSQVFDQCLYWEYDREDNISPFLKLLDIKINGNTNIRLNVTKDNIEKREITSHTLEKIKQYTTKCKNALKRILH